MKDTLRPGIRHTMAYAVPEHRTVPNLLPESADFAAMPQVLATGYMIGIIEWACMEALHVAPTLPGSTVTVDVEVTAVERRTVTFDVVARDENAVVSTGSHQRGVVDRARFEGRLGRPRGEAS
jgi:fluoroacetyl-CoA thioesterase